MLYALTLNAQQNLSAFQPFIGHTWKAEESWSNGGWFKQEITMEYQLDSNFLLVYSKGFTNQEQTEYGLRNQGIRKIDPSSGKIQFFEFDRFGGLTTGQVEIRNRDFLYRYEYQGQELTDYWSYVNDSTYSFKVGTYDNNDWQQVYLETEFNRMPNSWQQKALIAMKMHIPGQWSCKAWTGTLEEDWMLDEHNNLIQDAEYIEDEKVLYAAKNMVDIRFGELILTTIIQNGTPKIFKATSYESHVIVFENDDYSNPSKVTYYLLENGSFKRIIEGTENGQPTSTTFEFTRQ